MVVGEGGKLAVVPQSKYGWKAMGLGEVVVMSQIFSRENGRFFAVGIHRLGRRMNKRANPLAVSPLAATD